MNANEDTITLTDKFGHGGNCITSRLLAGRFALGAVLMAALTGCASRQATPDEYGTFDSVMPAALEAIVGAVNGLATRNRGAGVATVARAYGIEQQNCLCNQVQHRAEHSQRYMGGGAALARPGTPMPGVRTSAPRMGAQPPLRHRHSGRFR